MLSRIVVSTCAALLGWFCAWVGEVHAANVPLRTGAGVARSAASSTSYVTTAGAAWSGAAFNSGMTTTIGGRMVTVPAKWRLSANAGQIALNAIRVNPAGAAASAALSILIGYGIEKCADGTIEWCRTAPVDNPADMPYPASGSWFAPGNYPLVYFGTPEEACMKTPGPERGQVFVGLIPSSNYFYCSFKMPDGSEPAYGGTWGPVIQTSGCLSGHTARNGICYPPGWKDGDQQPATDSDWSKVQPDALTGNDNVLNGLGRDGVPLDVQPQFSPDPQIVPLSDPYVDPVTGKRMQDIATVQPNPDGKTATVQVAKREVDTNGNPVKDDSGADAAPQKQEDPCVGNEDRLGCMPAGDIPAPQELPLDERTIRIAPDSGWGADSMACPADVVVALRSNGGSPLSFSFKPVCDGADMLRPLVIGFAWISAVLIALGGTRRGE